MSQPFKGTRGGMKRREVMEYKDFEMDAEYQQAPDDTTRPAA